MASRTTHHAPPFSRPKRSRAHDGGARGGNHHRYFKLGAPSSRRSFEIDGGRGSCHRDPDATVIMDGARCSPSTTLDFPASPSAFPSAANRIPSASRSAELFSAFPFASACPHEPQMSPFFPTPQMPPSARLSHGGHCTGNGGEPSFAVTAFHCGSPVAGGASNTASGHVELGDWLKEAAAMMQTSQVTQSTHVSHQRVVGRNGRQSVLLQWFHDAPDGLVASSFPEFNRVNAVNAASVVNVVNEFNAEAGSHFAESDIIAASLRFRASESAPGLESKPAASVEPQVPKICAPASTAEERETKAREVQAGQVQLGEVFKRPLEDIRQTWVVLKRAMGSGQYGTIRRCVHRLTGEHAACKSIRKMSFQSAADVEAVRNEVAFMWQLIGHPNIIRIKQAAETRRHVHVVMELCEGGDLFDLIARHGRLSEPSAACIFRSLMLALHYCHSHGIVHRDVKPENILLSHHATNEDTGTASANGCYIRLSDFGTAARHTPGVPLSDVVGTPEYMAPEVLSQSYGSECDVWGAGIVLFMMLCGRFPFLRDSSSSSSSSSSGGDGVWRKVVEEKRRGFSHSWRWQELSSPAKHLIIRMLSADPRSRITVQEILEHEWVTIAVGC
ncbi:hypothetical protein CLOM_g18822 [Closterium sp. NIES-68]|nr:hypothetical protein CLOM_g18822 [Closterium sp. NIES-68]GJP64471.1 hypothetical protein CLOP_g21456 [Closterium sp. NIES-67]